MRYRSPLRRGLSGPPPGVHTGWVADHGQRQRALFVHQLWNASATADVSYSAWLPTNPAALLEHLQGDATGSVGG